MNKNNYVKKKQNVCIKMADEWLLCKATYKGASTFSKGYTICDNKLEQYIYNCGNKKKENILCKR